MLRLGSVFAIQYSSYQYSGLTIIVDIIDIAFVPFKSKLTFDLFELQYPRHPTRSVFGVIDLPLSYLYFTACRARATLTLDVNTFVSAFRYINLQPYACPPWEKKIPHPIHEFWESGH